MTRDELKKHCEKQIEECERWAKYKGEEPQGKIYEEHKLILELLEQEPFMNKPCISAGVCEHDKMQVLDKIRAEIDRCGSIMVAYAITKDTRTDKGIEDLVKGVVQQAKEQVLEIIDKYRNGEQK